MRALVGIAYSLAVVVIACSGKGSQRDNVDTAIVFIGAQSWTDSIMAVVDAYAVKRINADSAAKMMVSIAKGRSVNLEMDEPLLAAVQREMQKRSH